MSSNTLDQRYDFALLGTSLPLSILSAALARAGYSIVHVDDAEHYGGPWASLTLQELVDRVKDQKGKGSGGGIVDLSIEFRDDLAASPDKEIKLPTDLAAVNRHFAISLAPTLLPCTGPTIDVLIRSHVASYCTFRLLQQTAIYSSEGRAKDAWPLRTVPSSKEDIFKDKSLSLVDKRRLMKLLQQAASSTQAATEDAASESSSSTPDHSLQGKSFYDYLTSRDGPGFSERLASDVAYGVAMCTSRQESASNAMQRIQRHITSIGRYGNSAYLIGQYGGAGEMAQCYCRASAVRGGTFVLSHKVTELTPLDTTTLDTQEEAQARWRIALDGIDGTTNVSCVVGDTDMLQRIGIEGTKERKKSLLRQAVGILLLDRGMVLKAAEQPRRESNGDDDNDAAAVPAPEREQPPETALVVFPPPDDGSDSAERGAIWALQMGEGTFSCPKGTYLVYLCAALPQPSERLQTSDDARALLERARQGVLQLAQQSAPEWVASGGEERPDTRLTPLFESYMVREAAAPEERTSDADDQTDLREKGLLRVPSYTDNFATSLDESTLQAENLYWLLSDKEWSVDGLQKDARRAQIETRRRRQQRTAASAFPVGRGLAGMPQQSDNAEDATANEDEHEAICDFFPIETRDDEME